MGKTDEEGNAVPASSRGSWSSFLKSMASFNGDLSSMTAPPFILSTTSLIEYAAYWSEMPSLLVAPSKEADPQKRAMLVLRWFLSTLKQQYASRNEKLGSEKKPLNPFLGELFTGSWEDAEGTTQLITEQVSHHPPVTGYCISNKKNGVRLTGYNAQKASFRTTINVKQIGHAILHLDKWNEDYLITLPSLHIEGLIGGSPYVELNQSSYIVGSNGFTSRIDYSGKGWVSGTKNGVKAIMYPHGKEKSKDSVIYHVEGAWTDSFTIKDAKKNTVDQYNAKKEPKTPLKVAPISEQDPLESRRAWQKVADAIEKGDMGTTAREKTVIEESQRALRKKETSENRQWDRRFFTRQTTAPTLEKLLKEVPGGSVDSDQTNGIWLFDPALAKKANPKYNEEL